jgi:hypothetical protein
MCKRHWRAVHYPDQAAAKAALLKKKNHDNEPPPPQGESIYENILPASIAYRPTASSLASAAAMNNNNNNQINQVAGCGGTGTSVNNKTTTISNNPSGKAKVIAADVTAVTTIGATTATATAKIGIDGSEAAKNTTGSSKKKVSKKVTIEEAAASAGSGSAESTTTATATAITTFKRTTSITSSASTSSSNSNPDGISGGTLISTAMPLVTFLRDGALRKDVGWHRQSERRARGLFPASSLSSQLESWEKQLALVEILLLSGGTPYANFKDLAHAWGREKGFHHVLSANVCQRRGEVTRKRRSDAGGNNPNNITDSFGNTIVVAASSNTGGERLSLNKKAKRSNSNNQLQQIAPQLQQPLGFQQQQQPMIFPPQPVPIMTSKGVLPYPQHQQPQHVVAVQQHYPPPQPPQQQHIQPQQHTVVAATAAAPGTTAKNMAGLVPIAAANIGPYSDIIHQEELQAATKAAITKAASDSASKATSLILTETDRAKIAGLTTTGAYNATAIANNATNATAANANAPTEFSV